MECEYLIIFDNENKKENYCINEQTFNNIIESNSDVIIKREFDEYYIIYKNNKYKYENKLI